MLGCAGCGHVLLSCVMYGGRGGRLSSHVSCLIFLSQKYLLRESQSDRIDPDPA